MKDNPDFLDQSEKFEVYYEKTILPTLQRQEKIRIKCLVTLLFLISGVIVWYFIVKNNFTTSEQEIPLFDWNVLPCFLVLFICFPMFSYYRKIKESILPLLINFFGDFEYIYQKPISDQMAQKSKIIKPYVQLKSDDCFEGIYEGIPVSITEFKRYEQETINKNDIQKIRMTKKEQGIIFLADMNKKFSGQTIVVKDKGFMNRFDKYKNLQRVGLESPEFEKAYEVYSDNQIEARYILTAVMLDYLVELKQIFPNVEASFFDEKILLKINIRDNFFECSSLFSSAVNKKRIKNIFKQFYILFSIVKILHLNQKPML